MDHHETLNNDESLEIIICETEETQIVHKTHMHHPYFK